ncbi:MAG TPA: dihydropteroate synthase [Rhizomicrobium sp.]|nr:dihydropteroate synthase [Rhizomicrobium sp.]
MKILGILNITEDSFSDGGKYLEPSAALAHARELAKDANILDIGAASSNPDSSGVSPEMEIARLQSVVPALQRENISLSIDTYSPAVQRWALKQDVAYLNDIHGFPDQSLYPEIAASSVRLIVMHAVQEWGKATRIEVPPSEIAGRIHRFFEQRLAALVKAGIARERLILDPGMGFFLGSDPETSFTVLRGLGELKRVFGLPVLVSVSRKSFLRRITGRAPSDSGPASLAAELFAALQGADFVRTHDPKALRDGLAVWQALDGNKP